MQAQRKVTVVPTSSCHPMSTLGGIGPAIGGGDDMVTRLLFVETREWSERPAESSSSTWRTVHAGRDPTTIGGRVKREGLEVEEEGGGR
jgi:hypothetical protein